MVTATPLPLRPPLTRPADLIDVDDLTTPDIPSSQEGKPALKGQKLSKTQANTKLPKLTMPPPSKIPESPASASTPGSIGDGALTPMEGMSTRQLNVLKRKAKMQKAAAVNK